MQLPPKQQVIYEVLSESFERAEHMDLRTFAQEVRRRLKQ